MGLDCNMCLLDEKMTNIRSPCKLVKVFSCMQSELFIDD